MCVFVDAQESCSISFFTIQDSGFRIRILPASLNCARERFAFPQAPPSCTDESTQWHLTTPARIHSWPSTDSQQFHNYKSVHFLPCPAAAIPLCPQTLWQARARICRVTLVSSCGLMGHQVSGWRKVLCMAVQPRKLKRWWLTGHKHFRVFSAKVVVVCSTVPKVRAVSAARAPTTQTRVFGSPSAYALDPGRECMLYACCMHVKRLSRLRTVRRTRA